MFVDRHRTTPLAPHLQRLADFLDREGWECNDSGSDTRPGEVTHWFRIHRTTKETQCTCPTSEATRRPGKVTSRD